MGISKAEKARRKTGTKRKTEARGSQFGNTRGKPDKQARAARLRAEDPRYRAAMDEIEQTDARLAEINAELSGPAEGAQFKGQHRALMESLTKERTELERAVATARETVRKIEAAIPIEGDGGKGWSRMQARAMLFQGDTLAHVVSTTGYGSRHFSDIPLKDGRGITREEWIELQEKKAKRLEIEERKLR